MFVLEGMGVGDGEDFLHVQPAFVYLFVRLGFGLADAAKAGGVDGKLQHAVDAAGDPFGLVVAAFLPFLRVERDGEKQVGNIGKDGLSIM